MLSLSTPVIGLAVLLVGVQVVYSALDMLNISYGAAAVRDADTWIRDGLNISDPERILAYQRSTTILSRIQSWVGLAILLAIVVTGIYTDLTRALTQTGLTPSIQGVLLIAGAVAGSRFLSAPFDLYKTFVIEDRFGFNNQTVMLWLRDWIIGLVIGLIAATLIGGTVLWVIEAVPSLWPVLGWLIVIGVSLATMVIYPRVIAPLFNDFEPIESGALRDAVEDVFSRAGFDCEQIYEMDASRRSSHSNAYFIGFGRAKRVVLFDTLIEQMSTNSIQAVLAHELAHWKKAHIWKQLVASTIQMGAVFAFLWWITILSGCIPHLIFHR
jgi:Zn-dependent protease with chaperone function